MSTLLRNFFVSFCDKEKYLFRFFSMSVMVMLIGISMSAKAAPEAKLIDYWNDFEPASILVVNNQAWQEILDTYLDDDHESGIYRFNYEGVTESDLAKLDGYLVFLQDLDPRQLNRKEAMAYWLNAFNASLVRMLIEGVQDNDIESVRDLRSGAFSAGPWRRNILEIAGQRVSFDDIEHGILRPIYADPRVHFAMSAACMSCPNILPQAYRGSDIESQLADAEKNYLNHERAVRIEDGQLILARIFRWYATDFGNSEARVRDFIADRVDPELGVAIRGISASDIRYRFDWDLNKP